MSFRSFRRWVPLFILVLVAVGAWRVADLADVDEASTEAVYYEHELATPLLSARRSPETLRAPIIDANLMPAINTFAAGLSGNQYCLYVEIDDRVLADIGQNTPLIPASNQKLLTTYAALERLGATTTFSTQVRSQGPILDGVLDGDLYFVGGGDPFLSTEAWWTQYSETSGRHHTSLEQLADNIVASGIHTVTGALVGDESLFDAVRFGPWHQRLIDQRQSGPLSALSVNEGHLDGWPEEYISASRRNQSDDPPLHATNALARLLSERGVSIGSTSVGIAPDTAVLVASIESPPVVELVAHINSYSSNFGAEVLLKHIGLQTSGVGSTSAGADAVLQVMVDHGFNTGGVVVLDGSGLADGFDIDGDEVLDQDVLTCSLLNDVLDSVDPDSDFAQSLSIAGVRGSLYKRYLDSTAAGQVYAKTGTLRDVTALSGYVESLTEPDVTLIFSYVINGQQAGERTDLKELQQPFMEHLAAYPVGPSIDELRPAAVIPVPPLTQEDTVSDAGDN